MNELIEIKVQCPYCWERFQLLVDTSVDSQEYVEDCEICCRPIDFYVQLDDEEQISVEAKMQHE